MSEATTRGVKVKVKSEFVPERSDPQNGEFFFAYHVTIENHGEEPVKLLSRHWIITDGMGKEQEVRGPGVVGKQPILKPGQSFQYSSFVTLAAPNGAMRGTYQMITEDGTPFEIEIAPFALREPYTIH